MTARRFGLWLYARPHLTGLMISVVLALAIYGQRLEERFFPVLTEARAHDIFVANGRLYWNLHFCKLRELRLDASAFTFFYIRDPVTAVPLMVRNESRAATVDQSPLPAGCFDIKYSAQIPADAIPGDRVVGLVWYHSSHPFWRMRQDFGVVVVPQGIRQAR